MATYSAQGVAGSAKKLIFAPTGEPNSSSDTTTAAAAAAPPGQAGQFTKNPSGLHRRDLDPTGPIPQFHAWYSAATAGPVSHPETCTLSTASLPLGRVSARMVYLKELDPRGFVVYSNFGTSRKGRDLFGDEDDRSSTGNPWAALTFWWEPLERQVRVEGRVERLTPQESQVYFDTRARGSRLGAWASRQSAVLRPSGGDATTTTTTDALDDNAGDDEDDGRNQLQSWVHEAEERFKNPTTNTDADHIPVPPFWGGLRIVPESVEFWQGRESRLHDRFVYERKEKKEDGLAEWSLERLSP